METVLKAAQGELAGLEKRRVALLKIIDIAKSVTAPAETAPAARPVRPQSQPAPETLASYDAARSALRENGAPMKLAHLLAAVEARGVTVGGKSPPATLAARLSNSREFVNVRGSGWWLAGEPAPDNEGAEEGASPSAPNGGNQGGQNGAALADQPSVL